MASAVNLAESLKGYIVLQVESNGEAWYINPADLVRYYLGRPQDAWELMHSESIGISNIDLRKIPLGAVSSGPDTDSDNLSDNLELTIGTNPLNHDSDGDGHNDAAEILLNFDPLGPGNLPINKRFAELQQGKIFLQVEAHGEAWYVNPGDNRRYYLGRPSDALAVMRILGLGISNQDLSQIAIGRNIPQPAPVVEETEEDRDIPPPEEPARTGDFDFDKIELAVHERINQERVNLGLATLIWNNEVAAVARENSQGLVTENQNLTGIGHSCDYPLIHHEGLKFGFKNSDRLKTRGIYYFGQAGENIALVNAANVTVEIEFEDPIEVEIDDCPAERDSLDQAFRSALDQASEAEAITIVNQEINEREQLFSQTKELPIIEMEWLSEEEIADKIVVGWLMSPGHKENITQPDYEESGVGVAYVNGYMIATQIYLERVDCGYETGPCCEREGYYPYCYAPLECKSDICLAG